MKRTMSTSFFTLSRILFMCLVAFCAQSAVGQDILCGTDVVSLSSDNHPGRDEGLYKPAFGQIHALVVFARFPDDTCYSPDWGKLPSQGLETWMEDFIDPTTTPSNERYNLTSFFRGESFGNLIMTGDVYHLMAPNPSSSYSTSGTCYGAANRDLLEALHDSVAIDDSKYDQWSYDGVGNHINTPDGVYDLIITIWRRSSSFWFASCSGLDKWSGIARLGNTNFTLGDLFVKASGSPQNETVNGNTIYASPSGVTNYGYGPASTHLIVVHEIAHYLVSREHPYADSRSHSYFSVFGTDENTSSFNAYEKDMLGWISPTDISSVTSPYSVSLKDAASYGEALKFHVGDDEWFYIENRQGVHFGGYYDYISSNTSDRGLAILHHKSLYNGQNSLKLVSSDGFWKWNKINDVTHPFGSGTWHRLERSRPNVDVSDAGYVGSHRDAFINPNGPTKQWV